MVNEWHLYRAFLQSTLQRLHIHPFPHTLYTNGGGNHARHHHQHAHQEQLGVQYIEGTWNKQLEICMFSSDTELVQLLRDGCVSVSYVVYDDEQVLPAKVTGGEEITDLLN